MGYDDCRVKVFRENYEYLPKRFIKKIDADLEYILAANIPCLSKVYLFGSCARGDLKNGSDVDLLILTKSKLTNRELAADIRWTLEEPLDGVKTDVVFMNEESEKSASVFNLGVARDKKIILEV